MRFDREQIAIRRGRLRAEINVRNLGCAAKVEALSLVFVYFAKLIGDRSSACVPRRRVCVRTNLSAREKSAPRERCGSGAERGDAWTCARWCVSSILKECYLYSWLHQLKEAGRGAGSSIWQQVGRAQWFRARFFRLDQTVALFSVCRLPARSDRGLLRAFVLAPLLRLAPSLTVHSLEKSRISVRVIVSLRNRLVGFAILRRQLSVTFKITQL